MSFDLFTIWASMGDFAKAIVLTLLLMATASLGVLIERLWVFRRARLRSAAFGTFARPLLERGEYEALADEAGRRRGAPLAALIGAGLRTFLVAHAKSNRLAPVELAKRELTRHAEATTAELRRGFGVLASVGSIAPFVGLLGTVVGIIAAFEGIAKEGSGGLGAVSAGIAEALVVTALGLVVAIPAVLAFNYLSARADALLLALDRARGELVDHLESTPDEPARDAVDEGRLHVA
jgi:biopolymer transport protein ExbB